MAYTDGKTPDFLIISDLAEGQTKTGQDLILSEAVSETVTGSVSISGANNTEQYATLSFRQAVPDDEMIEIKAINVLNTTTYSEELPADLYTLVASTLFGFKTEVYSLDLQTGDETQNVVFNNPE